MTTIELINLTLNEIRRSAQVIADVTAECSMAINHQSSETVAGLMETSIKENNAALERCRIALREVLEDIANYQNACDMVENVDAAIGKVAYDLIYERTTDEDYETSNTK